MRGGPAGLCQLSFHQFLENLIEFCSQLGIAETAHGPAGGHSITEAAFTGQKTDWIEDKLERR